MSSSSQNGGRTDFERAVDELIVFVDNEELTLDLEEGQGVAWTGDVRDLVGVQLRGRLVDTKASGDARRARLDFRAGSVLAGLRTGAHEDPAEKK